MEEKLKQVIFSVLGDGVYFLQPDDIRMSSSLETDLSADSLDMVEIQLEIERQFDVNLNDAVFAQCKTVNDVYEYLQTMVNA